MNEQLQNALIASAFGMVGGGALKMCAASWRRKRLHDGLNVYTTPPHQNVVPVRVHNGYVLPLTQCWAYITLIYDEKKDIVAPPHGENAHILPSQPLGLSDDRLCWSAHINSSHSPVVDIYAGEAQALTVFRYNTGQNWINIASESMFSLSRVFLRADKVYKGRLKIISRETAAKEWEIKIDLSVIENPLTVRRLSSWFDPSDGW